MDFGILGVIILIFSTVSQCSEDKRFDTHPGYKYLPNTECGHPAVTYRIVGGEEAGLGQFPWMARLGFKITVFPPWFPVQYTCGGTLINRWYILTAHHCFNDSIGKLTEVRLGENDAREFIDCNDIICAPPVQDIPVEKVILHEEGTNLEADIALIKLARPAEITDFVHPICLPRGDLARKMDDYLPDGADTEVAGWGRFDNKKMAGSTKLLYVHVPITDLETCNKFFPVNTTEKNVICAGKGGGEDSCDGDSGGPLMKPFSVNKTSPRYFQIGVVSYGDIMCGKYPGVYTSVVYYLEWILDKISGK